jgi:hypothetical protein
MESAMRQLDSELQVFNISLAKLTQRRQLILAEYGYGGGTSNSGNVVARSGAEVGQTSYFGIFGEYKRRAAALLARGCGEGRAAAAGGPGGGRPARRRRSKGVAPVPQPLPAACDAPNAAAP